MRKPVVGISYKTYVNTIEKAKVMVQQIVETTGNEKDVEQFMFPSLGVLYPVSEVLNGSEIAYGAQNISPYLNGPYTGEFSIESLKEIGGSFVEIGHAERQGIFHETLDMINLKTKLTLDMGMTPVLCIGEKVRLDNKDEKKEVLLEQISLSLKDVSKEAAARTILAYEPVWAIGQAEAADAGYVHQTTAIIREILADLYGSEISEQIRIIYGGSVSKDNAPEIVEDVNIDGVFIGRFGHDPANYKAIVEVVKERKVVTN